MGAERKFTRENLRRVLLKEYFMKKTERAGFGGIDIQRTPMGTRITLIAERPGLVIGRRGGTINALTEAVTKEYGFYNPQIEVSEERRSALNAKIMAQKVSFSLERGWHFRRVGHSTVRRIMESGAKGCQVIIAGKLTGQRHRTEKFKEGHIKYCGFPAEQWMDIGYSIAKKKSGTIGVTVMIMRPEARLPDEIEVKALKDVAVVDEGVKEIAEKAEESVQAAEEAKTDDAAKPEEKSEGEVKKEAKAPKKAAKKAAPKEEAPAPEPAEKAAEAQPDQPAAPAEEPAKEEAPAPEPAKEEAAGESQEQPEAE